MKSLWTFLLLIIFVSTSAFGFEGHASLVNSQKKNACKLNGTNSIDTKCIEAQLNGDGLGGWVHSAVKDQLMFVFTWRRPGNFFVNLQLPMASKDPAILQKLSQLKRHDRILIKGTFFKNDAPLEHINVSELIVVEAYTGVTEEYQYDAAIPDQVLNGNTLVGKVHATANGGRVLVVEVGDRVYPVFNENPELVKDLYRNDKIELDYSVRFFPTRPPHLEVNLLKPNPVRVIEEIVKGHGQLINLKGALVMFPKSPQIKFNVYALRTEDSDGVKRNYTLVNFNDFDLFTKLREALEEAWSQQSASAKYDRNKFINPKIIVEASGTKNLVDTQQANPQILINDFNDLKITIL